MDVTPEVRQLLSDVAYLRERNDQLSADFDGITRQVGGIITTQSNTPPAPVSNLLYNGELGHSVNSWFDTAYTTDDKSKECAFWFSHAGTLDGLALSETDARTSSANKTLKTTVHSTYDPHYANWNSPNGWAELAGTATLDALLPTNYIDATTSLARVSFISSRANQYIEIPPEARMFAGIYDNTTGQLKFLTGSLALKATRIGTTAASTVERRYKIQVKSDRGFTLVSPEVIVTDAPADGFFTATKNVSLAWSPTAGQLAVQIYEYVPSLGRYRLLEEISSGFSYISQGSFLRDVAGYPVSPDSARRAIYYTRVGELTDLAINAQSPRWDTINFPIGVPDNYDKSQTTGRQWVRIGLTVAANYFIPNVTADGTKILSQPVSLFYDYHAPLYAAGFVVQIYDANDTLLQTTMTTGRIDNFKIQVADNVAAGTNLKIRIVGAGNGGVYIDKVHLGFQQNTSYAPNAFDNRQLQPLAAPTSSMQGGSGGGGTGGGVYNCVAGRTPIKFADQSRRAIANCKPGDLWSSGEFKPNLLTKLRTGFEYTRAVRSKNGCYLECTDTERFYCDYADTEGTPLYRLRVGDVVLTEIGGRIIQSRITEIGVLSREKQLVYTPTLSGSRLFIAGELRFNFWRRLWNSLNMFNCLVKGGFVLHNRKWNDYDLPA